MKTPYQLGKEAFSNDIHLAIHDKEYCKLYMQTEVGNASNIPNLNEWNRGYDEALEEDMKIKFPEMY